MRAEARRLFYERIQNEAVPIAGFPAPVFAIQGSIWGRQGPLQVASLSASGQRESDPRSQNQISHCASHIVPV